MFYLSIYNQSLNLLLLVILNLFYMHNHLLLQQNSLLLNNLFSKIPNRLSLSLKNKYLLHNHIKIKYLLHNHLLLQQNSLLLNNLLIKIPYRLSLSLKNKYLYLFLLILASFSNKWNIIMYNLLNFLPKLYLPRQSNPL